MKTLESPKPQNGTIARIATCIVENENSVKGETMGDGNLIFQLAFDPLLSYPMTLILPEQLRTYRKL